MTIHIVGSGLAGLLAANMLRHRDPVVHEIQSSLPNNHSAVLRFRTSAVGDVLNIPFQKVTMIKTHVPWRNTVADALAYSFKNTGKYRSDRSIISGAVTAERWIAPSNLIARMAERLDLKFGQPYDFRMARNSEPIISTLPMPVLMKELHPLEVKHQGMPFTSSPGLNIRARIADCDAYVSLLVPDPGVPFSRISVTGDEMIVEVQSQTILTEFASFDEASKIRMAEHYVASAGYMLGINRVMLHDIAVHHQKYAKINPIPDAMRKNFMFHATDKFGIYSLGRFATWRPGLLLDDLIKDIRLIDRWITDGQYSVARHR